MLGKAILEGIVVQPQFSFFFLAKVLRKPVQLHLLPSYDPELYKNLMFLKSYEGDAEDLCLDFTVDVDVLGQTQSVPLVRNGVSKPVTNTNKLEYIYRMANYMMNERMKPQCDAFCRGFYELIPYDWIRFFSEPELQMLISGKDVEVNIDDLKAHTRYAGAAPGVHIRNTLSATCHFRQCAALYECSISLCLCCNAAWSWFGSDITAARRCRAQCESSGRLLALFLPGTRPRCCGLSHHASVVHHWVSRTCTRRLLFNR